MTDYSAFANDLLITPVINAPFFIDDLFHSKFAHPAPDYGNGVICFYRKDWKHFIPLCFTSFIQYEEVILVGGAMTDGSVFRLMPRSTRKAIKQQGGVYYRVLKFAFDHFKNDCDAFFGHAGDKRAYEIDIRAGFEQTPYEHLIVNFHKPIAAEEKVRLIEKIHAIGPF